MAREDERDNFLGSFLFWLTMGIICTVFPKLMALSALWVSTFGDCFNAVAGQALGGPRIPWNRRKTLIGSATMFIVSVLALWAAQGVLSLDPSWDLTAGVALVAAVLESLPLRSAYDEFTVPFTTAPLAHLRRTSAADVVSFVLTQGRTRTKCKRIVLVRGQTCHQTLKIGTKLINNNQSLVTLFKKEETQRWEDISTMCIQILTNPQPLKCVSMPPLFIPSERTSSRSSEMKALKSSSLVRTL